MLKVLKCRFRVFMWILFPRDLRTVWDFATRSIEFLRPPGSLDRLSASCCISVVVCWDSDRRWSLLVVLQLLGGDVSYFLRHAPAWQSGASSS